MFSLKFKAPPVLISYTLPKIVKSKKILDGKDHICSIRFSPESYQSRFCFCFCLFVCFFFFLLHKNLFTQPEDLCVYVCENVSVCVSVCAWVCVSGCMHVCVIQAAIRNIVILKLITPKERKLWLKCTQKQGSELQTGRRNLQNCLFLSPITLECWFCIQSQRRNQPKFTKFG